MIKVPAYFSQFSMEAQKNLPETDAQGQPVSRAEKQVEESIDTVQQGAVVVKNTVLRIVFDEKDWEQNRTLIDPRYRRMD